ncbi:MAG: DUF2061 domain-containing protein [bacterium]|nr:DUF2061 domain-containing protein [bacterium]
MHETSTRSILKSVSWRSIIFLTDFSLAYLITREFDFASKFAVAKLVLGFALYFVHERVWNQIAWGRKGSSTSQGS